MAVSITYSFRKADILAVLAESHTPLTIRQIAHSLRAWDRNYVPYPALRKLTVMLLYYTKTGAIRRIESAGNAIRYTLPAICPACGQHTHCDNKP